MTTKLSYRASDVTIQHWTTRDPLQSWLVLHLDTPDLPTQHGRPVRYQLDDEKLEDLIVQLRAALRYRQRHARAIEIAKTLKHRR